MERSLYFCVFCVAHALCLSLKTKRESVVEYIFCVHVRASFRAVSVCNLFVALREREECLAVLHRQVYFVCNSDW